jgi:hypothetical protein
MSKNITTSTAIRRNEMGLAPAGTGCCIGSDYNISDFLSTVSGKAKRETFAVEVQLKSLR